VINSFVHNLIIFYSILVGKAFIYYSIQITYISNNGFIRNVMISINIYKKWVCQNREGESAAQFSKFSRLTWTG
jgi:hypothetical protein